MSMPPRKKVVKKPKPKKSLLSNGLRSAGEQMDEIEKNESERLENIQKAVKKRKEAEKEKKFLSGMPSFDMIDLEE